MNRPLVLLHGFTGSPDSWREVRLRLSAGPGAETTPEGPAPSGSPSSPLSTPVLVPALLGHDGTPGPPGIGAFADEVDRLAGLIRAAAAPDSTAAAPDSTAPGPDSTAPGPDSTAPGPAATAPAAPSGGVRLAGYSMGGRLALGLLVRHPELFASATLIGASPGLVGPAERTEREAGDEEWARLLETEGLDTFVAAWEALPLFATQESLPPDERRRQRRIRRSHDPRGLARALRVAGLGRMPDYRPRLAGVDLPIRLVVGERDAKFRALAMEMADRLPRATIVVVPGAGHNVVLERPAEIAALLGEDGG